MNGASTDIEVGKLEKVIDSLIEKVIDLSKRISILENKSQGV